MSKPRVMQTRRLVATAAIVLLFVAGCAEPRQNDAAPAASDMATSPQKVDLQAVDREKYDSIIDQHRGDVVLVDFWATWCLPCIEQLPHTIELAERLRDRRLSVVAVSLDDPAEAERVAQFLGSKGAGGLVNLISRYGVGPESMTAFEIASGAVPHYKLYDRSGRLRRTFELDPLADEQFTPQEIDGAIEQLLAE